MSIVTPVDRDVLATAVADSIVVASDPRAPGYSAYFWDRARPWTGAVTKAVAECDDQAIRSLGRDLAERPRDPAPYFALRSALVSADMAAVAVIFDLAWQAECNSRMGYELGASYDGGEEPVGVGELLELPRGRELPGPAEAEVLIVVPFQDRSAERNRLRNLLACLLALRDQSSPRERYQVTVVETDTEPRWAEVIRPVADHYLFAAKPGPFNKSWTVNVGVRHTPGRPEAICILDADVLVDRHFVERNAARFQRPGAGGHLTYRDMLCLDEAATSHAIRERVRQRKPEPDPAYFRGFSLRRPPGCCVWVRSGAFERIGGMDERYEGWGGEDYDFLHRLDLEAPLDNYDDWLLHMNHPPSSYIREDGGLVDVPPLSWAPGQPIGDPDRFAATQQPSPESPRESPREAAGLRWATTRLECSSSVTA